MDPRDLPTIAIEATFLTDERATGIGRYTRQLIEALSALDLPAEQEFRLLQLYKRSRWRLKHRLAHGPRLDSAAWFGPLWPLPRPSAQVLHVQDEREPPWRTPLVATIHDLYAALNINYTDEKRRLRKVRHYEHLRDRCSRLVCVSENTRRDFLRLIGGDPERLKVVPLGVSPMFRPHAPDEIAGLRSRLDLPKPYLMFVGATANKNLARTLAAFSAGGFARDFTLAVVGEQKAPTQAPGVRYLGHVDDAELPLLYAGAEAYLFPSLYEGFGLPILEAMASGTPVLTSDRASCPEVAAGHAVIADPEDVDALAAGMAGALNLSQGEREAALAYARSRSWEATARGTLAVWREAMAEPARR